MGFSQFDSNQARERRLRRLGIPAPAVELPKVWTPAA